MADGSYTHNFETLIIAAVHDAMEEKLSFNALRRKVAALGKAHGVFVSGTDRIDGVIYVSYDGGADVQVQETEVYKNAVSVSTW